MAHPADTVAGSTSRHRVAARTRLDFWFDAVLLVVVAAGSTRRRRRQARRRTLSSASP